MNQNSPIVLDIDREIDNTLAETQRKIAALSETATRMNTIITESKFSRARTKPRSKLWLRALVGIFAVSMVALNIAMAVYISRINDEYKNHVVMTTAQQRYFMNQIRCIVDSQQRPGSAPKSDCVQYFTDTQ